MTGTPADLGHSRPPHAAPPGRRSARVWAGRLLVLAVLIGMLPLIVRRVGDTDYWWHVVTGGWIVQHGLPVHDLYTYTVANHQWVDHEYLSELLLYGLSRLGGELAVSLVMGAITWVGFWFILKRIALQRAAAVATAGSLAMGVVAGVAVWGPRPQMITFTLVCVELYLLERFIATGHRALYVMPLIVAVWGNFHGGVLIAFLFLGIAFIAEAVRWLVDRGNLRARGNAVRIAAVGVACALAGLLNPYGFSLYTYAWRTQTNAVEQAFVREWQSPDFHEWQMRGFGAMLLLLLVGLALRRTRPSLFSVLLAVTAAAMALESWRHIVIFVAAATPLLAWSWSPALAELGPRVAGLGRRLRDVTRYAFQAAAAATVVATVIAVAATALLLSHQAASTADNYPAGAANFLAAHPEVGTRMFSDEGWGGYMIYRFFPDPTRRVWMYGEVDLAGDALLNQYSDVVNLNSDWLDILTRWNVDYVVFEPNRPLTSALAALPNWRLVYSDKVAVIYVRTSPAPATQTTRILRRHGPARHPRRVLVADPRGRGVRG